MQGDPLGAIAALPGVFDAVEAARGAVDLLLRRLRSPQLRRRVTEVTAEALRASAWASTVLDGRPGDLEAFQAPVADARGSNTLALYAELGGLAAAWERAPGQALARMHVVAAAGLVSPESLGRPVTPEAAARLETLVQLVTRPTAAPAVVVASVVHGEVLAVDAFDPVSGLVGRAAARCVMVTRGLDPRAVTIWEGGHLELGVASYRDALARYRSGTAAGVGDWVSHCAQAVALGAAAGRRLCDELGPEVGRSGA